MKANSLFRIFASLAVAFSVAAYASDTLEGFMAVMDSDSYECWNLMLVQDFGYEDNKDEAPRSDRSSTWKWNTYLDASFAKMMGSMNLGLDAGVGYKRDFHKGDNDDSHHFTYKLSPIVNGTYQIGRHSLMVKVTSKYEEVELDRSDSTKVMLATNSAKLGWTTPITGKLTLAVTGDYTNKHYGDNDYQEYNKQVYGFRFAPYWNPSERTRLGVTAGTEWTDYQKKDHDDFTIYNFGAFGTYSLTKSMKVYAEAGAQKLSYRSGSDARHNDDNGYTPYVSANAKYIASDDLDFTLRVGRKLADSWNAEPDDERTENTAAFVTFYRLTGKISLKNEITFANVDEKDADDDLNEYGCGISASYAFNEKLVFVAGWKLIEKDYQHRTGDYLDNEYHLGMTWMLK